MAAAGMIDLVAASGTHASLAHVESTLITIEQLLIFAVPLLTIVGTAYIGLYLHLRQKLRENHVQLATIQTQTDGQLERLTAATEQLAAGAQRGPRRAGDPEPPAQPPAG